MTEQQIQWMAATVAHALRAPTIDGIAVQPLDEGEARITFFAKGRAFDRDLMLSDTEFAPPDALVNDVVRDLALEPSGAMQ